LKVKILQSQCDPSAAQDRTLPTTAYLVEYIQEGQTMFDIVVATKKVDIFDHYWDNYRDGFCNMTQTEGRVNSKLWVDPNKKKAKS
jgi:hypothetical protein